MPRQADTADSADSSALPIVGGREADAAAGVPTPDGHALVLGSAPPECRPDRLRQWLVSFANLAAGESAASAMRLLAYLWVADKVGPGRLGTIGVGFVVGWNLVVAAHSGLETIGVRQVAVDRQSVARRLGEIVGIRLLLAGVTYALAMVVMVLGPFANDVRLAVLGFGLSVFTVAADVRWSFVGTHHTRPVAWATSTAGVVYLAGMVLLVRSPDDFLWFPLVHVAAEGTLSAMLVVASRRRFGWWRPRLDVVHLRSELRAAAPITLMHALRSLMISLDVVIVALMLDDVDAGRYSLASKVMTVGIVYLSLYYLPFLPSLVQAWHEGTGELRATVRVAVRRVVWLALPLALLTTLAVPSVVKAALDPSYQPAAVLVQVLVWSLVLFALTSVYRSVLLATGRDRCQPGILIAALVANVAANLVLLPNVGVIGAPIATVLAEGIVLALCYSFARPVLAAP